MLALAVVLQCYPLEWQYVFFWDAWLAITIQLGLLRETRATEKIINTTKVTVIENEVFPCQWLKQVFYAEKLLGSPGKVKGILMGHDPVSKVSTKQPLSTLRKATGIAYHNIGDGNPSIKTMTEIYGIDCTGNKPINWCEEYGLLLVNMVRCICCENDTMEKNTCYDAWVVR